MRNGLIIIGRGGKMRKVICPRCGKKFKSEGKRVILCDECWKKARVGKVHNKFGCRGKKIGKININLDRLYYLNFGKLAGEHIRKRNIEIIRLNALVDELSKENLKLKEEITILKHKRIEL